MSANKPIKSKDFPGFYEIPRYGRYVISKEGKVVKKETGESIPSHVLGKGYISFNMTNDDGVRSCRGRHRLLGIVFKHPCCSIDDLVVNHLNGIPGSDDLENLEWTTQKGNIEHAGRIGLSSKCTPIAVRDVATGEVCEYPSIVEYARVVGWSKDRVNWRIRIGEGRVFPEGKQYRQASITKPWYIPEDIDLALLLNTRSSVTLIKNVFSDEITEYPSLSEAARQLGVSKAALSIWIRFKNMPVLRGFIQAKFAHDPRPWRPVSDPYLEIEVSTGTRVVRVTEEKTGTHRYFASICECAKEMGLNPTAVSYRLKSKGLSVFMDGFRYAYYLDVVLK